MVIIDDEWFPLQPTPEEDEPEDEDGDVDDVSESDNDELDTDVIDERDSADDVIFLLCILMLLLYLHIIVICWSILDLHFLS